MDAMWAMERAKRIVDSVGTEEESAACRNFREYAEYVAYLAKHGLTWQQRSDRPWFKEWARVWRELVDNFDKEVEKDPMIQYAPAHSVSTEFHSSPAFVRFFCSGNRCSKTQSGFAEQYWVLTGQHPYQDIPRGNTFLVGLAYNKYAPNVFERKFLTGEDNNILAPMFPVGGKWFYHYDERRHVLTVACPECANAGTGGSCPHPKTTISLFSDQGGYEVLMGGQYTLGQFDEHIPEQFFNEATLRLSTVPKSSFIVTGTPLAGPHAWEQLRVASVAKGDPKLNLVDPSSPNSRPYASYHNIDQYSAGLVPHERIRGDEARWDEFEVQARIYGHPSALAENPVFDRHKLQDLRKAVRKPRYVKTSCDKPLTDVAGYHDIGITEIRPSKPDEWTGLRLWDKPVNGGQYIAAVDSARGVAKGDASCCSIIQMVPKEGGFALKLVAQYHGWLNAFDYADEVFKLAVYYNSALVAVETTGGYGDPVLLRLRDQLYYWNIHRGRSNNKQAQFSQAGSFGVDTNQSSKPYMIAALQNFVKEMAIEVPCLQTISEMVAFEQVSTTKSGEVRSTPLFRGASGSKDDRVMSLAIGVGVVVSNPVFDFVEEVKQQRQSRWSEEEEEQWQSTI